MTDIIKRLPVIRHIRYYRLCFLINRHYDMWNSLGSLGGWTEDEITYINDIWRGKA